ncbi:MAG TPA: BNR-4 repeat-containing protein [Thermoguttaceae bacterium]|nr:BNR-4 repeat-containing protein [Thermoguttaceae bacterium]
MFTISSIHRAACLVILCLACARASAGELPKADGYRGIWYMVGPQRDEYRYKYSGGLGTYCAHHRPLAFYSKEADKTFFCYGGTARKTNTLLHMVSYYDHKTGMVPRPRILMDKKTRDAHDNPVISMDNTGHLWIFSGSHGTQRPSYIWVGKKPYDIDEFDQVNVNAFATKRHGMNYSYPQPHYLLEKGFCFLMTRYTDAVERMLFVSSSPDGRTWTIPKPFATIEMGQYQVSEHFGEKVGTCFNFHPRPQGADWRTNLYYMETSDGGKTWTTVDGTPLETPLTSKSNPALVHDYQAEKRLVYVMDLNYDSQGRPLLLYLTSRGAKSGPVNDPRIWQTARWTGENWDIQGSIHADNNYDTGSIYIEKDDLWRFIAPSEAGPQPYNPGGEVVMWISRDQGKLWTKVKQLTHGSKFNHTYCRRPVNAHPDFYAFWADGHGRKPSESRLYFTNRDGDHVWRLPVKMKDETAKPEIAW